MANPGLFGPTKDALFPNLRDRWCVDPERLRQLVGEPLAAFMTHLHPDPIDERLLVLLGAFLVESALDDLLRASMPGFERLRDNLDFSFSIRTEIVRALGLCPPAVLQAVDAVRKIRNAFAHNIAVDKLSKTPTQMDAIRTAVTNLGRPDKAREPDLYCFRNTVEGLVLYLHLYADRVRLAFEFTRSDVFTKHFKRACDEKFAAKWTDELKSQYDAELGKT